MIYPSYKTLSSFLASFLVSLVVLSPAVVLLCVLFASINPVTAPFGAAFIIAAFDLMLLLAALIPLYMFYAFIQNFISVK